MFENHKKVAFNIASEASYSYIFIGQRLIKNAKNPHACVQTVLPNRPLLIGQGISGKCKKSKATFWVIFKHCESGFTHTLYNCNYFELHCWTWPVIQSCFGQNPDFMAFKYCQAALIQCIGYNCYCLVMPLQHKVKSRNAIRKSQHYRRNYKSISQCKIQKCRLVLFPWHSAIKALEAFLFPWPSSWKDNKSVTFR